MDIEELTCENVAMEIIKSTTGTISLFVTFGLLSYNQMPAPIINIAIIDQDNIVGFSKTGFPLNTVSELEIKFGKFFK